MRKRFKNRKNSAKVHSEREIFRHLNLACKKSRRFDRIESCLRINYEEFVNDMKSKKIRCGTYYLHLIPLSSSQIRINL
ncbi:unnamed protein product [Caenorhabditis brenneri]